MNDTSSAATPRWVFADGRCAACGKKPCIRSVWCVFTFSEVRESILRHRLRKPA